MIETKEPTPLIVQIMIWNIKIALRQSKIEAIGIIPSIDRAEFTIDIKPASIASGMSQLGISIAIAFNMIFNNPKKYVVIIRLNYYFSSQTSEENKQKLKNKQSLP